MKDYLDIWTEETGVLYMDTSFSNSIGFAQTENGWGIPKDYLVQQYRVACSRIVERRQGNFDREQLEDLFVCEENRILDEFEEELKGFDLLMNGRRYNKGNRLWDEVFSGYISYILKGELYAETFRVYSLVDNMFDQLGNRRLSNKFWKDMIAGIKKKEVTDVD